MQEEEKFFDGQKNNRDFLNKDNESQESDYIPEIKELLKDAEEVKCEMTEQEIVKGVQLVLEKKATENNANTKTNPNQFFQFLEKTLYFLGSLILDAIIVLTIVVVVRVFVVSPFQVKGHSMDNSFADNDFIIVDQLSYRIVEPKRGDVIVFRPPSNSLYPQAGIICSVNQFKAKILKQDLSKACLVPEYFVKRVIGVPGDTVEIKSGKVYVTPTLENEPIEIIEPYLNENNKDRTCVSGSYSCNTNQDVEGKKYVVPENYYFVLGDNRNGSNDSRHWRKDGQEDSYVPFKNIRGKVRIILWPLADLRIVSNTNPFTGE